MLECADEINVLRKLSSPNNCLESGGGWQVPQHGSEVGKCPSMAAKWASALVVANELQHINGLRFRG